MKWKIKNPVIRMAAVFLLGAGLIFTNESKIFASAVNVMYEQVETRMLTKDVTYQAMKQVTDQGLRDIYFLKVPINDPNIKLKPAESLTEYSLKETVKKLIADNKAIAGVNADFFGMQGDYSASAGPVIRDGILISVDSNTNSTESSHAAFFIDNDNNPFMTYLKSDITFKVNGIEPFEVGYKNKVGAMRYPAWIDRNAMTDTRALEARITDLYKVVVEGNVITKVSPPGQIVEVPENGYIVTIAEDMAWYTLSKVPVGAKAEMTLTSFVDFEKIQTAIGGGGYILLNNEPLNDKGLVPSGRHPRTVLGITSDKQHVILMVVDGRNHSIGASKEELIPILRSLGVDTAINLDGGGSTTMVVMDEKDNINVVNTPSDNGERRVINAFGVFNDSEQGLITEVKLVADDKVVFLNEALNLSFFGMDEYLNKILLDPEQINLSSNDPLGRWVGAVFYPGTKGEITLTAQFGSFTDQITIHVTETSGISISPLRIQTGLEGQTNLKVKLVSAEGFSKDIGIDNISFEVVPSALGVVENGVFIAKSGGRGYIKCSLGDFIYYIEAEVAHIPRTLISFETHTPIIYTSYPVGIPGFVEHTSIAAHGSNAVKLNYTFRGNTSTTQAAYLLFENPVRLEQDCLALKMSVYGDDSGHWLRMKLVGANGAERLIDLARTIDWNGYKDINVNLPKDMQYPITLERIYIAATSNEVEEGHSIIVDNIQGIYYVEYPKPSIPKGTIIKDNWERDLIGAAQEGASDILIAGEFGRTAMGNGYKRMSAYHVENLQNASLISLTAARGGLTSTDPSQWKRFNNDILSSNDKKNIIILIDKSPLNFSVDQEYNLFHQALIKLKDKGKNIMVISSEGSTNSQTTINGIRYINLGSSIDNFGSNSSTLKLRISESNIYFQFQ